MQREKSPEKIKQGIWGKNVEIHKSTDSRYRHLVGKCVRIRVHNFTEKGVILSDFAYPRNQEKGVFFSTEFANLKTKGKFLPG